MIRNGGKITKATNITTNSSTIGAKGVYDTFDAYNARLGNLWPITQKFSKSLSVSTTTIFQNSTFQVTNISENVLAGTTLYWTLERISGPQNINVYFGNSTGSFTQPTGENGQYSFTINTAYREPDPTREPIQFRVNIRTGSLTGPIVNSSAVITMPVPIPTLQLNRESSAIPTNSTNESEVYSDGVRILLDWTNVGTYQVIGGSYTIAYSSTADLLSAPTSMSVDTENTSYFASSSVIKGKKDYLTEGTETVTITVTNATYGWLIGNLNLSILDTSTSPVTTITPAATSVEKGNTIRFDVAIENAQETTIYYVIVGSAASKFSTQSGSFQLSAGGITLTALNNFNYTEADTTFQVQFRAQSTAGYLYGTSPVITVTSPPQPTATIVPIASVDEGSTNSFVVNTTNISGSLNWKVNERKELATGYTTSLLTCQSATIVDNSTNNFAITNVGGVTTQATSGAGVPSGSYSNYFNGANWLTVPNSSAFDFGTGNWTIEMWIKPTVGGIDQFFYAHRESENIGPFLLGLTTDDRLYIVASIGNVSSNIITAGSTIINVNTWTHIAAVRNRSTFTTYVNGVQDYVKTGLSGAMLATTSRVAIGSGGATNGNTPYYGYLSNLRAVKGGALYTSNFTPSTVPLNPLPTIVTGSLEPQVTDFFTANSGILTLNNGSGTITLKPRQDTFTEGSETFRLTVSLPSNQELTSLDFTINDTSTGTAEPLRLYEFSTFKFLSGNSDDNYSYGSDQATQTGNSLATLLDKYGTSTYPWLSNTSYYNVVTAGIQQWTVPFTGVYRFKVAGAKGGWSLSGANGGGGAILNGEVFLTRDTVVNIVVGKMGATSADTLTGGGGGGGTFVYTGAIGGTGLLFAAGGGGGGDDSSFNGQNAREDLCAGFNLTDTRANPTDGQGAANAGSGGGSGCGWLSDSYGSGPGTRFNGGGASSNGGVGGFGGGGGDLDDGGGGGGYTGGTSSTTAGGGCGGSYYNLQLVNNYTWGGNNITDIANGFVEVTAIATGATAVITPSSSTITEGESVTFNIVTTGFTDGTLFYNLLTNSGSISSSEFTNTSNFTGSVIITDSIGQVTYTYRSDTYTEGTEAISLLVYYNTGGIRHTVGTSSQVSISDTSAGSAALFSLSNIIKYNPGSIYTNYEVSTSPSGQLNVGAKGWTILRETTTATADSYFSIPLPFSFKINNTNFTSVLINENAWMVFGASGTTLSSGFVATTAASAVPYNKLVFSGGNNSMQRLFYRVDAQNRFILIRYEGNASTSGTQGNPGIIAEIKLLNPLFTGGISMIELKFNTNRTVSSSSHSVSLSSPSGYFAYYAHPYTTVQYNLVFYALNAEATSWTIVGSYYNACAVVL